MFVYRAIAALAAALLAGAPAQAQTQTPGELAGLINAYRAAPRSCDGRQQPAAPALAMHPALAKVRIGAGAFLQSALKQAGYAAARAEVLYVSGAHDARAVMDILRKNECGTLLGAQFADVGVQRDGGEWQIVFAQPAVPRVMPAWQDAGQAILAAVNAARAQARTCGDARYGAAPPVEWNPRLADAALAHSEDMAKWRYFSHQGKDGSKVGERAHRAGYQWLRTGENIASGMSDPDEAVAGWLDSPGHCANIMHPGYNEMGAAYAVNTNRGVVYWTQVFGASR